MITERWILIGIIGVSILALWKLVPRGKKREAWLLFLSLQLITWPTGIFVAEMGWVEYPIQLFKHANAYNKSSLTFEFFLFPVASVIFSLYHPETKKKRVIFFYYVIYSGFFTGFEIILEKTTDLIKYHGWKWYWTLISLMASLFLNHCYFVWFRRKLIKEPINE